ncbi:hypothetical protein SAMN05444287_0997 [Octadecabacter temperatus]|uniref:Uncharacterized protein n=2 Tax=Octadecabacter temperatus TaxID=1458307 RepID=A0A0K0Y4K8_9RHOB|nr:hypothetical protein [Octadecabacter temperatus]AKS45894.1 hypothetical protein OSB_13410 [Octadecabacter temperatus]SIO02949.1 hypothetical protein SAMN05444287_0997 [Octadecabacter temperatus]
MQEADHILIPLLDGRHGVAQVVRLQDDRVFLYLSNRRHHQNDKVVAFADNDVNAFMFVDIADLPDNHWPVIGYDAIPNLRRAPEHLSWDLLGEKDPIHDPSIIEAFANAVHGLYPWDGFPDPEFFTNMLSDPNTLPPFARMTSDFPSPE